MVNVMPEVLWVEVPRKRGTPNQVMGLFVEALRRKRDYFEMGPFKNRASARNMAYWLRDKYGALLRLTEIAVYDDHSVSAYFDPDQ